MENENTRRFDEAASVLPQHLMNSLLKVSGSVKCAAQEIRLRSSRPLILSGTFGTCFVYESGRVSFTEHRGAACPSGADVFEALKKASGYSIHTHQDSIAKGFLTFGSGHRMGICGTAVGDAGGITNIREPSSLNIRIARTHEGCSADLLTELFSAGFCSTIIAGPPLCGKTTLLRDMAMQLSSGFMDSYLKVAVVDERFELSDIKGACSSGINCDILRGCRKDDGIIHVVRSMAPDVVICDEIGTVSEAMAVRSALNSGVRFILSVHSGGRDDFFARTQVQTLLSTGEFGCVVFMTDSLHPGRVSDIIKAGELNEICGSFAGCSGDSGNGQAICTFAVTSGQGA